MVFGANTYRAFSHMLADSTDESDVRDPWVTRMRNLPAIVVSNTLQEPLDWPDATVVKGDAVDVVARLKEESDVPLRSHGSLSMNRALMAVAWSTASRSRCSRSSPAAPAWTASSRARPTSTSNCSNTAPWTTASRN